MLRDIAGIRLCGANFDEVTNILLLDPHEGNKVKPVKGTLLYGRNGAGKSTLAKAVRKAKGESQDTISQAEFLSINNLPIELTEEEKSHVFVFDEEYIDKNVKFHESGLDTIIMLGHQVEIAEQLQEAQKNLEKAKGEFDIQEKTIIENEKIECKNSPKYHIKKMRLALQGDDCWAGRDKLIKNNRQNTGVRDDTYKQFITLTTTRLDELNGVVSVCKKEISEKREQLKKLENLQKMAEVIKANQPLIDEYNHFFFPKKREKYYQQHKKEINYYRKCERELKQHLDKNGKVPTARWKREKEELRSVIEELKADNQPYQDELAFVKKVQSCADIARCDREMAETDTSGRSEEKREKQVKFPAFHAAQTEDIFEENSKAEQHSVNQTEPKPEKKTSLLKQLAEKKKECEERDAKQQTVRKKRNYDMSL